MALYLYYAALTTLLTSAPVSALSIPNIKATLSARQSNGNGVYAGGSNGDNVDSNGGASGGHGGSFQLSTGGLIAIIVVVVAVVIFGVATTVLFVMAKRRQWNIRASIRRASRRITGRDRADAARDRKSKREGIQLDSQPAVKTHKRGLVVEVKDAEKGQTIMSQPKLQPKSAAQPGWASKFLGSDRPRDFR